MFSLHSSFRNPSLKMYKRNIESYWKCTRYYIHTYRINTPFDQQTFIRNCISSFMLFFLAPSGAKWILHFKVISSKTEVTVPLIICAAIFCYSFKHKFLIWYHRKKLFYFIKRYHVHLFTNILSYFFWSVQTCHNNSMHFRLLCSILLYVQKLFLKLFFSSNKFTHLPAFLNHSSLRKGDTSTECDAF